MLGALIKATGILDFKEMVEDTRKKLEKKFKSKPEVIEGILRLSSGRIMRSKVR